MVRRQTLKGGSFLLNIFSKEDFTQKYDKYYNTIFETLEKAQKPSYNTNTNTRTPSIDELKIKWSKIENELLENRSIEKWVWKKFILTVGEDLAKKINNFRKELDLLLKKVCNFAIETCKIECISSGSDALTSDIDVTIKGNCIVENYIHLQVLHDVLRLIFKESEILKGTNEKVDIAKIFIFFDINFYLSNFGIKFDNSRDNGNLGSYILSAEHEKQITYAIEGVKVKTDDYDKLVYRLALLKQKIGDKPTQEQANEFVDIISQIAGQEDECYVTQGAFFHVVMLLQQGQTFFDDISFDQIWKTMMVCSAIENLKFAKSHPSSRGKYIIRVYDALYRIKPSVKDVNQLYNNQQYQNTLNPLFNAHNSVYENEQNNPYLNFRTNTLSKLTEYFNDFDIQNLISEGVETENLILQHKINIKKASGNSKVSLENDLKQIKKEYEILKKDLSTEFEKFLSNTSSDKVFTELEKEVLTHATRLFLRKNYTGGKTQLKKLMKNGTVVKKLILGRERVVYVNSKRKQFYKSKDGFKLVASVQNKRK
jgi:hypothetical protein